MPGPSSRCRGPLLRATSDGIILSHRDNPKSLGPPSQNKLSFRQNVGGGRINVIIKQKRGDTAYVESGTQSPYWGYDALSAA